MGFGLLESLLTLALVIILSASSYALFGPTSSAAAVSQESARLDALVRGIDASHSNGLDFSDLTQTPFSVPGFQSDTSVWGQPFSVLPTQISAPNDAWVATYQGVEPDVCAKLGLTQINAAWVQIAVDGQPVTDSNSLLSACTKPDGSELHELQFTRYTGPRHQGVNGHDCLIQLDDWCGTLIR